jgi:NADH dehydrogenase
MVNVGQELLMQFNAPLRAKSRKRLEELGIVMHMGVAVSTVEKERLVLADGSDIPYGFLLWTAGVAPVAPEVVTSSGSLRPRLPTTTSLELKDTPGVFVLGDVSLVETPDGKGYPMVAQVATRQALVVARNIKHHIQGKPLVSFSYQSQGSLVSLGQWYAVGVIFGISISGRIAWFIWRTVYVTKFHSWSKRIKILSEWTQNIFWSRDITKLN